MERGNSIGRYHPNEASGVETAFWSCPKLGQGGQSFMPLQLLAIRYGLLQKGNMTLGEAALLAGELPKDSDC